jgi:phage-related minor tail protein
MSMLGGGGGAGFSLGGMMFGGVRAAGGPVKSGRSYLVGEKGPEMFTPGASGMITPNHVLGRGTATDRGVASPQMNVTVINNTPARVNTSRGADGGLRVEIVEEMVANAFARGGSKIDAAIQRGYGLRRAGR